MKTNEDMLPRDLKNKNSETLYLSEYALYYLKQKAKKLQSANKKGAGIGKALDQAVLSMPDFKKTVNDYLEENKL